MGFNRYIVECKGTYAKRSRFDMSRFNRYIVECKGICGHGNLLTVIDLIDTLWNVKWHMNESRKHLLIKR